MGTEEEDQDALTDQDALDEFAEYDTEKDIVSSEPEDDDDDVYDDDDVSPDDQLLLDRKELSELGLELDNPDGFADE